MSWRKMSGSLLSRRGVRIISFILILQLAIFFLLFFSSTARYNLRLLVPVFSQPKFPGFAPGTFEFASSTPPTWISTPPPRPLVIRLAIITQPGSFERRQLLRQILVSDIPETDVKLDYKFVVGYEKYPPGAWISSTDRRVEEEQKEHGDILILKLKESRVRLTEKRYRAMQWAGQVPADQYDWFMTLDDDTFCRLPALARRMAHDPEMGKADPRKEPILVGRSMVNWRFWKPTVPDMKVAGELDTTSDENAEKVDMVFNGPWYQYPGGIGYLISSHLAHLFLTADPPLPHHVAYPCDDVIIGSWAASLDEFRNPNPAWKFETGPPDYPKSEIKPVVPIPHLKERVVVKVVNDSGWHNLPGRQQSEGAIGWDSVCLHKPIEPEMRALRNLKEFRGEWIKPALEV